MYSDKKGKLYGAIFMFAMYFIPLIIINLISMDGKVVEDMNAIKAILKSDIQYTNIDGIVKNIKAGDEINVTINKEPAVYTRLDGTRGIERAGSYTGEKDNEHFDIDPSEFKTID